MKKYIILFLLTCTVFAAGAQILKPVKWSYAAKRTGKHTAVLLLKANIDHGWHIYSQQLPEGGPVRTAFRFDPADFYTPAGRTSEPAAIQKFEPSFKMNVRYFERSVVFQQKIALNGKGGTVSGKLTFMACNDKQCLPPEELAFSIPVK